MQWTSNTRWWRRNIAENKDANCVHIEQVPRHVMCPQPWWRWEYNLSPEAIRSPKSIVQHGRVLSCLNTTVAAIPLLSSPACQNQQEVKWLQPDHDLGEKGERRCKATLWTSLWQNSCCKPTPLQLQPAKEETFKMEKQIEKLLLATRIARNKKPSFRLCLFSLSCSPFLNIVHSWPEDESLKGLP